MDLEVLRSVIAYAQQQAEDSRCQILEDTTGYGYESADYYEMQRAALDDAMTELLEHAVDCRRQIEADTILNKKLEQLVNAGKR